jgi:hypothetical protein
VEKENVIEFKSKSTSGVIIIPFEGLRPVMVPFKVGFKLGIPGLR